VIIDASALVAILRKESDADELNRKIVEAASPKMSASGYFETAIVIDAERDPVASARIDDFIRQAQISIEPVTEAHARIAREAYRNFGKGSGHAARLNFGDCFAYALAKDLGEPLLFKGNDFSKTDVEPA
jgi:ribonuclease VapC